MSPGGEPLERTTRVALPRVAVASDQSLVAESVHRALRERGHATVVLRWPPTEAQRPDPPVQQAGRGPRAALPPPDVAVLLSELDRRATVDGARTLVRALPVPWLVLAGVARGPAWGALYESGATVVMPTDTDLDTVCNLVSRLGSGTVRPPRPPGELLREWHDYSRHHDELSDRFETLTGREEQVLQQLHEGLAVRRIAEEGAVTEATVRSQVKAILRKLGVSSQIAAVAAYQEFRSGRGLLLSAVDTAR